MRRRGFTLLEVMVSLSILALALTAIAGINANSFESSNYARHLTVATLLARSKMIDVEEELRKEGFGDSDKEYDGDFSEEGYPKMRWQATCRKTEIDIGQMIGGMLGGQLNSSSLPKEMQEFIGAMQGESTEELNEEVSGSDLKQLMGGEMAELMFKQVGEVLGNSIREITLEIKWGKEGYDEEEVKFVQYVTTTGRLNFQNVVNPLNAAAAAAAGGLPGGAGGAGLPGGINPLTGKPLPGARGGVNPNAIGGRTGLPTQLPGGLPLPPRRK